MRFTKKILEEIYLKDKELLAKDYIDNNKGDLNFVKDDEPYKTIIRGDQVTLKIFFNDDFFFNNICQDFIKQYEHLNNDNNNFVLDDLQIDLFLNYVILCVFKKHNIMNLIEDGGGKIKAIDFFYLNDKIRAIEETINKIMGR